MTIEEVKAYSKKVTLARMKKAVQEALDEEGGEGFYGQLVDNGKLTARGKKFMGVKEEKKEVKKENHGSFEKK